jgi:hypothetical protein
MFALTMLLLSRKIYTLYPESILPYFLSHAMLKIKVA